MERTIGKFEDNFKRLKKIYPELFLTDEQIDRINEYRRYSIIKAKKKPPLVRVNCMLCGWHYYHTVELTTCEGGME